MAEFDWSRFLIRTLILAAFIYFVWQFKKVRKEKAELYEKHNKDAIERVESVTDITRQLFAQDLDPEDRKKLSDALHRFGVRWDGVGDKVKPFERLDILQELADINHRVAFRKAFWLVEQTEKDKREPHV